MKRPVKATPLIAIAKGGDGIVFSLAPLPKGKVKASSVAVLP